MTARVQPIAVGGNGPPTTVAGRPSGPWWTRLDRRRTALVLAVEAFLLLSLWQVLIGVFELVNPVFLPPPSRIADGLTTLLANPELPEHLGTTMVAWLIGFVAAIVIGTSMGIAVGGSVPVERLTGPILWTIYATPWLAYRPLSVVWFGFGLPPIVFLVFIAAVFPVLLNTAAGVRAVEPSMLSAARVFGIGRLGTYRHILMPSALPFIIVGMRQSAVMATISLIVAEMTGSSVGLGALIAVLTNQYQTGQIFALVAMAVIWTVGIGQLLKFVGRRLAPWQSDSRSA